VINALIETVELFGQLYHCQHIAGGTDAIRRGVNSGSCWQNCAGWFEGKKIPS
jgi:hypothetical protein